VTDDQTEEVENQERYGSDEPFHWEGEKVKREHVEQQVPDICVHKSAQYDGVPLTLAVKVIRAEQTFIDNFLILE
jgi:hypothetical protein